MAKEKRKAADSKTKKAVLTLFILLFPALLLAIADSILEKVLLFFYIAIIIKNFVDSHYEEKR
jgi:hypothetical protein